MKTPQVPPSSLSFSVSFPSCFGCLTSANKAFTLGREPSSTSSCHFSATFHVGAIPFLVPLLPQGLDVNSTTTVTFTFTDSTRKPPGSLTWGSDPAQPKAVGARGLTLTSSPASPHRPQPLTMGSVGVTATGSLRPRQVNTPEYKMENTTVRGAEAPI